MGTGECVGALLRSLIKKIAFLHPIPSLSAGGSIFCIDQGHMGPFGGTTAKCFH
jgi:hypothetical protein